MINPLNGTERERASERKKEPATTSSEMSGRDAGGAAPTTGEAGYPERSDGYASGAGGGAGGHAVGGGEYDPGEKNTSSP